MRHCRIHFLLFPDALNRSSGFRWHNASFLHRNAGHGSWRCVVETPDYLRDADQTGLTADERTRIVTKLARDPTAGVDISGTGRARKLRFAGRGKGKSGGYRVITFYAGQDIPVFLLNVFAEGDKVDLTKAERNELRAELAGLASEYRLGVRRYVQGW